MATTFFRENVKRYGNTTLHTNYKYFVPAFSYNKNVSELLGTIGDVESKIDYLKAKEREFYRKFGKDNFDDFMKFLKELMNSNDGDVIRRLSNENLRSTLLNKIRQGQQDLTDEEITIEVSIDNTDVQKATKALQEAISAMKIVSVGNKTLSGRVISYTDNHRAITVKANVPVIKTIINKFSGTHFNRSSFNSRAISSFLSNDKNFERAFTITDSGGAVLTSEELSQKIKYRPYPWGYTNSEIKKGLEEDPVKTKEMLDKAKQDIKREIDNLFIGASRDLIKAKDQELSKILGNGYNIFFVGSNWENGLIGAFGEFGTAVLLRYLYIKTGKNLDSFTSEIIGQQLGKQDVRIFDGFGIQVKNYATYRDDINAFTRKNIEVRQHPSELGEYFDKTNSESFCGFLANYFFNTKINDLYKNQFYDLQKELEENFTAELLRFAVKDIEDTVTFYNIGSQYFVPASAILEFYVSKKELLDVKIEIERSVPIYTDEGGESRGNNEYWVNRFGNFGDGTGWTPTQKNTSLYAKLINNDIKIISTMQKLNLGYYGY